MIDFLLIIMYLALAGAIGFSVWSAIRSLSRRDKSQQVVNRIPVARIAFGTVALLVVLLLITFLFGSASPMSVNGESFDKWFWLKASDMFIATALLLMLLAVVGVVLGITGFFRRFAAK